VTGAEGATILFFIFIFGAGFFGGVFLRFPALVPLAVCLCAWFWYVFVVFGPH